MRDCCVLASPQEMLQVLLLPVDLVNVMPAGTQGNCDLYQFLQLFSVLLYVQWLFLQCSQVIVIFP